MKTVEKSVLLWHTPKQMYNLVTDVPRYPEFLPWCREARIVEQHADGVTATLGLGVAGINQHFTTRNTHEAPHRVQLALVDGPFSHLEGHWRFDALDDGRACKVSLSLSYQMASGPLAAWLTPVFDKIAANLVQAFVQRAERVYPSQ